MIKSRAELSLLKSTFEIITLKSLAVLTKKNKIVMKSISSKLFAEFI